MKPKNHARLEREVRLMQHLGGAESMVDLYAVLEDVTYKYLVGFPMTRLTSLPASGIAVQTAELSALHLHELFLRLPVETAQK